MTYELADVVPQPAQPRGRRMLWITAYVLVAAAVGAVTVYELWIKGPTQEERAYQACEQLVRDQLKAPATVKFSGESMHMQSDWWVIDGAVDAHNSYSTLMRSQFECVLKPNGDGTWQSLGVSVS